MIFFFHSEIKEQDTLEIKEKETIKMLLNLELVFVLVLAMKYSRFWFRSPEKLRKNRTRKGVLPLPHPPPPFLSCPFWEINCALRKSWGEAWIGYVFLFFRFILIPNNSIIVKCLNIPHYFFEIEIWLVNLVSGSLYLSSLKITTFVSFSES